MKKTVTALALAAAASAPAVAMQERTAPAKQERVAPTRPGFLLLYREKDFVGMNVEIREARRSIRAGWDVRSIAVHPGERWQICNRPRFRDPCIIIDRSIADTATIGANGVIDSARPASEVPAQSE